MMIAQRFANERFLLGIKTISDASGSRRIVAITSIRFEKNCAIRFTLCMSICDYFTNIIAEYTGVHAFVLR
jgi:hypothetical protein